MYLCRRILKNNQNMENEELYKNRGVGATLRVAYTKFLSEFKPILRHVWKVALLFAVSMAALQVLSLTDFAHNPVILGIVWLALLFFAVVYCFLCSRIAMYLNARTWKWNLKRVVKVALLELLIGVLFSVVAVLVTLAITKSMSPNGIDPQLFIVTLVAVTLIVVLLACLLYLPISYGGMKYLMEPTAKFKSVVGAYYRVGLRHWGYLFLTHLVLGLVLLIISLVVNFPITIVNFASAIAMQAMAVGDAAELPGGFLWIVGLVSVITFFASAFITVFSWFVQYFIYGSIEQREKERAEARRLSDLKITEEA